MVEKDAMEKYYEAACRTCLNPNGEMLSLSDFISDNYGVGSTQVTYMECLRSLMSVQELGFDMPKKICKECASALQVSYSFIKNASKAQELLKLRLRQLQEKRRQLEHKALQEALKRPNRYRCKVCNIKVETKRCLKDHVKLHLDIIVYNCQMCAYENNKRNYLIEHYQLVHGVEATPLQLKPKRKPAETSSANINSPSTSTSSVYLTLPNDSSAAKVQKILEQPQQQEEQQKQQQQLQQSSDSYVNTDQTLPYAFTSTTPLQQNSEYMYATSTSNITALPLEGNNTASTTIFTQSNGETFTFNTFDSGELNAHSDLDVGNEFVVLADGTVQDAMGRGVVILQSADDGSLALQNGLVLENLIQVPNAETANLIMAQNEETQMDVDDLIVEEPQNSPDQDLPGPVDEDMIPASIIKKISCKICTKDFDSQGELKTHMLTHSEIPHFFCELCIFYTFFKIDLQQHYKSKHNIQPTHKQLLPRNRQRTTTTGNLNSQTEVERKNVVVQRIERYPKSPRNVYYCDICFFECDLKCEIKRHYSTKHKIQVTDVQQRISKTLGETVQIQPKSTSQQSIQIQAEENGPPDYPNGLNCRKCNEIFYWRNELYEHYKLHNAEELALKQQKQQQQITRKPIVRKTNELTNIVTTDVQQPVMELTQERLQFQQSNLDLQQPALEPQPQENQMDLQQVTAESQNQQIDVQQEQTEVSAQTQFQQQQKTDMESQTQFQQHQKTDMESQTQFQQQQQQQTTIPTTNLDNSVTTYDTMSLGFNANQNMSNPAPLTPSSTSTYTLPSDAIPQIVEMEQTIETDMDFDFNGDALFEDFDDVNVENESDDNDMRNIILTSDDDYEEIAKNQTEEEEQQTAIAPTHTFCAQCQKTFLSHYQFENHMFLHRGLAPYRCEMCTNLYNTKRALIRHYKAIHKKVPSRDMIQAKGDKVYVYDKTPMDYLNASKSITLMCGKCTYESIDFPSVQLHLNTNHSIHEDLYILKKLPYECPRCIRSFASNAKLMNHLEHNHSTTPINLQQIQMNSSNTTSSTTTTTTAPSLNNNVNMMDVNAECGQDQQIFHSNPRNADDNAKNSIHNGLALSNCEDKKSNVTNACNIIKHQTLNIKNKESNKTYPTHGTKKVLGLSAGSVSGLLHIDEANISKSIAVHTNNNNQQHLGDIKIEDFTSYPTTNIIDDLELSRSFNSSLNKIEETNISNCKLLKSEDAITLVGSTVSSDTVKQSVVLYKCQLCDVSCATLESVVVHGKSVKCSSLHKLSNKEKPLFQCELCLCKYKTLTLLTVHLKRHIARKYRCTHCPKTYVSQNELENHQGCHRNERPHKCDLCPNSFRYVHHLKRHKDIIHLGKRYTCPEANCTRQFTSQDQLKIHKWSHYGIVPYKCKLCERFFKKRFLLRDHCLKNHNIRLTEKEVAEVFRNNLGYSSPHDMTVAVANGSMMRRDEWESLPYALQ